MNSCDVHVRCCDMSHPFLLQPQPCSPGIWRFSSLKSILVTYAVFLHAFSITFYNKERNSLPPSPMTRDFGFYFTGCTRAACRLAEVYFSNDVQDSPVLRIGLVSKSNDPKYSVRFGAGRIKKASLTSAPYDLNLSAPMPPI